MANKQKINAKKLAKVFPSLSKIDKKNVKNRVVKLIKRKENDTLDAVCECVSTGLGALKPEDFNKKDLKNLTKKKELLRFLSEYSKCSKDKKQKLKKKRDISLVQSGQGLGILLATVLPILANLIIKKFT
jgi:hypothetical protein